LIKKRLSDSDIHTIKSEFGEAYDSLIHKKIKKLEVSWHLRVFELILSFSANLLIKCTIQGQKKAILKISARDPENFKYEASAIKAFDHPLFVRIIKNDSSEQAMLLEVIEPGTCLRKVDNLNERVGHFLSLYKKIHKKIVLEEGFPTYLGWVEKITKYMNENYVNNPLTIEMNQAYELSKELWTDYPDKTLLHGDFHHDNILLDQNSDYRIIDPKGVIGPSIFDLPRFILNEFDEKYEEACRIHIKNVVGLISGGLNIPKELIKKCLFIETCMGACWCVQDDQSLKRQLDLQKMIDLSKNIDI
jgi:streptomycin 6-kinase